MSTLGVVGGYILIALYLAAGFYIGKRMHWWFKHVFPKMNTVIFTAVYTLMAAMALASLVPMSIRVGFVYALRLLGGYMAGILMYLLMFLLLADLVMLCLKIIRRNYNLSKVRFYSMGIAVILTVIVAVYGIYNATQLTIVNYEVELMRDLDGEMNIVFISDLHLGEVRSENGLERMVEYINSLDPDIVCIIGDIFNDDFYAIRDPYRASALLRGIDARFGVFACLGNHDTGETLGSMLNFLAESNVHLLKDEHVIIDNRLVLIGRLDRLPPWLNADGFGGMHRSDFAGIMDAVHADLQQQGLSADLPVVVIDHNPENINEYGSDVDLALFGHTHGGSLFPITLVTRMIFVTDSVHFQRDNYSPHIIVTQGVHVWSIPMRVGTHNEVARVIVR